MMSSTQVSPQYQGVLKRVTCGLLAVVGGAVVGSVPNKKGKRKEFILHYSIIYE